MRMEDQRPSDKVIDARGQRGGGGGRMRGGLPVRGGIGLGGLLLIGVLFLLLPDNLKGPLIGMVLGGGALSGGGMSAPAPVEAGGPAPTDEQGMFVRQVLGSTEDVWTQVFQVGMLPSYNKAAPRDYPEPEVVLFSDQVNTGCGNATSAVGPFYCPLDQRVYIDLTFYETLRTKLKSPGDFAQAYVLAHEVGHHVQNQIGATDIRMQAQGTAQANEMSVRTELQADCFAGVWAHFADRKLDQLSPGDLDEALNAAHAIGDDTLQRQGKGYVSPESFTHGSSEQRRRWFTQGYNSGDARTCDTFRTRDL
jgi:hypothetical protein